MANTESSRINRISRVLIPSEVFLGKRHMTEWDSLQLIPRSCHICGCSLNWKEFIHTAHLHGNIDKFGIDILREIWKNDVFVIKCCSCFKGNPSGRFSDVIDSLGYAFEGNWHEEYEQNPVY